MNLTISEIARILSLEPASAGAECEIEYLLTDSRSLTWPEKTLFFAVRTSVNDGHRYVRDLYLGGVRNFVVEHIPATMSDCHDARFLVVNSVVDALQKIGTSIRIKADIPVIGITGSRGKTMVKEMLYHDLRHRFNIARSPRSWNSQIGVPLSLWQIRPDTDLGIFEAGISRKGEMAILQSMIRPTIGIFTSLTDEHDEGFSSQEEKCAEKAILFKDCRHIVYPKDNPTIARIIGQTCPSATLHAAEGSNESICDEIEKLLNAGNTARQHRTYDMVSTRIDVHEGVNNCLMIYDGFTCDITSVESALDFMNRRITSGRSSTIIIGDLEHGNEDTAKLYAYLAKMLAAKGVGRMIAIGKELAAHRDMFTKIAVTDFLTSSDRFIEKYTISDFDSELILIKGTPQSEFRLIKNFLEAPRHETILEVNLDAVTHNFNHYRSLLRSSTGIVAMVKASGYGTGSLELAKTLQTQGAAYLAVAVVDEGVELRQAGITMPIMVMNPMGTNYQALFNNHLEPSVFSLRELQILLNQAERWGQRDYPVHIKLDTGMHRLGFIQAELRQLTDMLNSQDYVKAASIFSHLATADCPDQDEYTQMQLSSFDKMSGHIISSLPYPVKRHILNTAGIMRYPQYQYDMVRLGIGLYGISPIGSHQEAGLAVVSRLSTTIISIKRWPASTTIGYARKGVLSHNATIATIPVGYADGINRHLGNGNTSFYVNGKACPTIGNICMDQCMIDVTDADARIGDEVEIFGPSAPVERLATTLDTIPYEILTSVSPRVKRIYYKE